MKAADEYEIGYGRPPKSFQFRKGHSGNPKGKAPGVKSVATLFQETTQQLIEITEGGEGRTVTKLEAIMLQLVAKAVSGDLKAMKEILQWHQVFEHADSAQNAVKPDKDKDAEVMRNLLDRMNRSFAACNETEVTIQEATHEHEND